MSTSPRQVLKPITRFSTKLGFYVVENGGADEDLELVGRQCKLTRYKPIKQARAIPEYKVSGEMIAYASPDSTYSVTKRLFEEAEKSILIGIYDFTADYMKDLILDAMSRGVAVSLMLDIDGKKEEALFEDLARYGCECVPAPSCASDYVHFFPSSHEKVVVIDGQWVLVQSGNYSNNSIPLNLEDGSGGRFRPGNRDMGIAVQSPELAALFCSVLRGDMELELDAEATEAVPEPIETVETEFLERAPRRRVKPVPSCKFTPAAAIPIQPVLSPDNYVPHVTALLDSATTSIDIEQQYIKWHQPLINGLVKMLQRKAEDGVRVRIIVAKPMARGDDYAREVDYIAQMEQFGLNMGEHVRILNPEYFVHCHNKLIIVDGRSVLASSQNWSDFAVGKNREAGLILHYPEVAEYFGRLFQSDWSTGLESLDTELPADIYTVESLNAGSGELVRSELGDYIEL